VTGGAASVASGRVAYVLGLEGPAVSVDTACSSSLVALHLACQSVRSGESSLALAGGVTVLAGPEAFVEFSRQRALAPDGRCKAFAAAADGMGMAEGVGVVVVERLSDARRHGHRVLAVVAGSAMNQDGASNGLTAPNGPSQQRVIRQALANAGVNTAGVDAVEAHGTGTKLGDPIEAQALLATYGQGRPDGRPLWLGSVKSNIGHAQAAAGVAGVIKMVLAMRHQVLPATLHADEPSPEVDWESGAVRLLRSPVPWPRAAGPRRAGVSSFGISGTNVHMILADPSNATDAPQASVPAQAARAGMAVAAAGGGGVVPWVVSGRGAAGLAAQARRLAAFTAGRTGMAPEDVGVALAGRAALEDRAVVVGTAAELAPGLAAVGRGETAAGAATGQAGAGKVAFVFAGQGSQRAGMGRELYERFAVFAAAVDEVCGLLAGLGVTGVREVVLGGPAAGQADGTLLAQAGLLAVQVALARLLASWGLVPDAVAGHSVGEVAAAHVAGALPLGDACALVAARGELMAGLPEGGAMASIQASEQEVAAELAASDGQVAIAAVNGPSSVVVSGERAAVAAVAEAWQRRGRRVRWLRVSHAFHSPLMEPVLADLAEVARGLAWEQPRVPMVSGLTGAVLAAGEAAAGDYWARHARQPVRFADAVGTLRGLGTGLFVEIGPDGSLSALAAECLEGAGEPGGPVLAPVLRPGRDEVASVTTAAAAAWVRGVPVDWARWFAGSAVGRVELPTYAFQHQRYWPELGSGAGAAMAGVGGAGLGEERFWAAVERRDVAAVVAAVAGAGADEGAVAAVASAVPVLSAWRRRERDRAATAGWLYQVRWRPAAPEPAAAQLAGTWLVVAPPEGEGFGLALRCVQALSEHGAAVVLTVADPARAGRAGLAGALAGVAAGRAVAGVVSLLGVAAGGHGEHPVVAAGVAGTLVLVQALGDAGVGARLWSLTRTAVAACPEDGQPDAVQGQVWGLGRVAGLEHPDRWGGLADLPPVWDGQTGELLCAVLAGSAGEDQVAIRGEGLLVRRLERASQQNAAVAGDGGREWRPRGTVLITGGTGALGAHVARWAAGAGAGRVVLTSRSGPGAVGAARQAARLAGWGAGVLVAVCDVADRDAVAALTGRLAGDRRVPLTAVVHAAGVRSELGSLEGTDAGSLAQVLAAKAAGAARLDELLGDAQLDAFVLFSSAVGTFGSAGQGSYATANAFLDGLAERRRARGLTATSIAWGPWGGGGIAVTGQRLRRDGMRPMEPGAAVAVMRRAVAAGEACVVAADVDWERLAPALALAGVGALVGDLPEVAAVLAAAGAAGAGGDGGARLAARLAGLDRVQQDQVLTRLVQTEAAAVLGHASAEAVPAGRAFKELGFDSLTAVELRNRLAAVTGRGLPATLVFDYPTPSVLAGYLRAEMLESGTIAHVFAELDKLELALCEIDSGENRNAAITRLQTMLSKFSKTGSDLGAANAAHRLESATLDEVLDFIDAEL
jgi:acyl transferase domain-containing protein